MLKIIASNTLAQLVAKFVGAGLTFVTTALIIRLSGTTIFGDLTKSLVLIAIGFTIIDFGLNAIVVRSLGRGQSLPGLFGSLLTTRLILSLIVVAILNVLVYILPGSYGDDIKSVFYLGSLAIIFQGIYTSCNAIFQYRENYWHSTTSTVLGTLVGAGLTYYYLLSSPSLPHFLLATTIGYFVMALTSLYLVKVPLNLKSYILNLASISSLLRLSLPLGAILLASVASSKLDTVILGIFQSSDQVGEYGFAYRIFDVLLVFPVFLMNAVYPRLVKINPQDSSRLIKQILSFMLLAGTLGALITWYMAPMIDLIRPGLTLSIQSLRILGLSLPLFFLTAPLMWYQISSGKETLVLRIYLLATAINLTLNLTFIPLYGVPAAATITGLTELFIFIALLYYSYKPNHIS